MKKLLLTLWFVASSTWATNTITVPLPPGGVPDQWTRIVAKHLSQELATEHVVVNRPGADGRLAIEYVATQPSNGKNLITVATGPFLFNKVLFNRLPYDYNDFEILAPMVRVPLALSVGNHLGVNSLKEFIALSRTRTLNCAGSSASSVFVGKLLFHYIKPKDVQFVPFKGSADMNLQLASGNIDCAFDTTTTVLPLYKDGKYKIIAVSTETTWAELPSAALFSSVISNLSFYNWYGIGVKTNTPNSDKIFAALKKVVQDPSYQSEMARRGMEIVTPQDSGSQWIHNEYLRFETIRQQLKIEKLD